MIFDSTSYMYVLDKRNTLLHKVSSRGRPAIDPAAADFPGDVCLTVSRNHKVFILYHIILHESKTIQYIGHKTSHKTCALSFNQINKVQYIAWLWTRYSLCGLHIWPSDTALLSVIAMTTFKCIVSASVTKVHSFVLSWLCIDDITEPTMTSQRLTTCFRIF